MMWYYYYYPHFTDKNELVKKPPQKTELVQSHQPVSKSQNQNFYPRYSYFEAPVPVLLSCFLLHMRCEIRVSVCYLMRGDYIFSINLQVFSCHVELEIRHFGCIYTIETGIPYKSSWFFPRELVVKHIQHIPRCGVLPHSLKK